MLLRHESRGAGAERDYGSPYSHHRGWLEAASRPATQRLPVAAGLPARHAACSALRSCSANLAASASTASRAMRMPCDVCPGVGNRRLRRGRLQLKHSRDTRNAGRRRDIHSNWGFGRHNNFNRCERDCEIGPKTPTLLDPKGSGTRKDQISSSSLTYWSGNISSCASLDITRIEWLGNLPNIGRHQRTVG